MDAHHHDHASPDPTLSREQHLAALERDALATIELCERTGLGTPVPMCGDWTMADLVWHVGGVYSFFGQVVAGRRTSIEGISRGQRPPDDEVAAWSRSRLADVIEAIRSTPDDVPVWTFGPDQTVNFVHRRMAIETAVHRWDAEHAAGAPMPIDGALASDGLDEFLHVFVHRLRDGAAPVGGTVHLHCGDVPGEWTLRPDPSTGAWVTTREHAFADCALRGTASDLLLAVWRRIPLSSIDVRGDAEVAARFVDSQRL